MNFVAAHCAATRPISLKATAFIHISSQFGFVLSGSQIPTLFQLCHDCSGGGRASHMILGSIFFFLDRGFLWPVQPTLVCVPLGWSFSSFLFSPLARDI